MLEKPDQDIVDSVVNPNFQEGCQQYHKDKAQLIQQESEFNQSYPQDPRSLQNDLPGLDSSQKQVARDAKESARELDRVSSTIPERYREEFDRVSRQGSSVDTYLETLGSYENLNKEVVEAEKAERQAEQDHQANVGRLPEVQQEKQEHEAQYDQWLTETRAKPVGEVTKLFSKFKSVLTGQKESTEVRPAIPREFYDLSPSEMDAVLEGKGPEAFRRRDRGSMYSTTGTSVVGVSYEDARKALEGANVDDVKAFREVVAKRNKAANEERRLNFEMAAYEKEYPEFRKYDIQKRAADQGIRLPGPGYEEALAEAKKDIIERQGLSPPSLGYISGLANAEQRLLDQGIRPSDPRYEEGVEQAKREMEQKGLKGPSPGYEEALASAKEDLERKGLSPPGPGYDEIVDEVDSFHKSGRGFQSEKSKLERRVHASTRKRDEVSLEYPGGKRERLSQVSRELATEIPESRMRAYQADQEEYRRFGKVGESHQGLDGKLKRYSTAKSKYQDRQRAYQEMRGEAFDATPIAENRQALTQSRQRLEAMPVFTGALAENSELSSSYRRAMLDGSKEEQERVSGQVVGAVKQTQAFGARLEAAFRSPQPLQRGGEVTQQQGEFLANVQQRANRATEAMSFAKFEQQVIKGDKAKDIDAKRQEYLRYLEALPEGTPLTQEQINFRDKEGPKIDAQVDAIEKYKASYARKEEGGETKTEWSFSKLEQEVLSDVTRSTDVLRPKNIDAKRQIYNDYLQELTRKGVDLTPEQTKFRDEEGPKIGAQVDAIEKYKTDYARKEEGETKTEWSFAKLENEVLKDSTRRTNVFRPKNIDAKRQIYNDYLKELKEKGVSLSEAQESFSSKYETEMRQKEIDKIIADTRAQTQTTQQMPRSESISSVETQAARRSSMGSNDSMGERPPTEEHVVSPKAPPVNRVKDFVAGMFKRGTKVESVTQSSSVTPQGGVAASQQRTRGGGRDSSNSL